MAKLKNHNPQKILWFIVMFFVMTIASYTQERDSTFSPNSSSLGQSFNEDARQLSQSLADQTGITSDKSDLISQILISYRNDIADARNKFLQKGQNQNNQPDVTGGQSRVNMTGLLGNDVDQYYVGATPDLMSDYKDADQKADSKIKEILGDETAQTKYDQVKGQWWKDVKDKVFSSLSEKPQELTK